MTENSFNMQSFHHSIYLDKNTEEIYSYIGTPDGFTKWFIGDSIFISGTGKERDKSSFIQTGDKYQWRWLEKDYSTAGEVMQAIENSTVKFTFGKSFIVTIVIKEDKGRTLLTLKQDYITQANQNDFAHINCCVCWAFFLTNLKSVAEFGNDLREIIADNEELVNR